MTKKRTFGVLLALALMVVLAACGGPAKPAESSEASTPVASSETVETSEQANSSETANSSESASNETAFSEKASKENSSGHTIGERSEEENLSPKELEWKKDKDFAEAFVKLIQSDDYDPKKAVEQMHFLEGAFIDEEVLLDMMTSGDLIDEIKNFNTPFEAMGFGDDLFIIDEQENRYYIDVYTDEAGNRSARLPKFTVQLVSMKIPDGAKLFLNGKEVSEAYFKEDDGDHKQTDVYEFREILKAPTKFEIKSTSFGTSTLEMTPKVPDIWTREDFGPFDKFTEEDVDKALKAIETLYNKLNEQYEAGKSPEELRKLFGPDVTDESFEKILEHVKDNSKRFPRIEKVEVQQGRGVFVWRDQTIAANIKFRGNYNIFRDGTGISERNRTCSVAVYPF